MVSVPRVLLTGDWCQRRIFPFVVIINRSVTRGPRVTKLRYSGPPPCPQLASSFNTGPIFCENPRNGSDLFNVVSSDVGIENRSPCLAVSHRPSLRQAEVWSENPGVFISSRPALLATKMTGFYRDIATLDWGEFKCVMLQPRPKMILFQFPKIRTLDTIYKVSYWFMFFKFIEG